MIFISEIGMNYNGNINLCYELIKLSKYSGANIVKFQIGWRQTCFKPMNKIHHRKKESKARPSFTYTRNLIINLIIINTYDN